MKLKKVYKEINKNGMYFFILFICVNGMWIGTIFNFLAIQYNEGKMPVLGNFSTDSTKHFTFQNKSEVNYYYFSDIFRIKNLYFSLGDFIMIFFLMILVMYTCYRTYKLTYIIKNILKKTNNE